jgi:effector-binding domain-containing protein
MKILKWLLFILLILAAFVLIVPLFLPSTVRVSAGTEIALSPEQVFHNVASYTDRTAWDPWLQTDPEAEVDIVSKPGYIGSEYTWNGRKIKTGRMVVDSVVYGRYIASGIYFGKDPNPARVEWNLENTGAGTGVTWQFTAGTSWPLERLMMNLFKGPMKQDLEKGLSGLKKYLEEHPPQLSSLGEIQTGTIGPMYAMVIGASGTMDQFGEQMSRLFPKLAAEVERQGLQMSGVPFSHYLSYNRETGVSRYLCGIPVASPGKNSGEFRARAYPEIKVLKAIHTGPYEGFIDSYGTLMDYIAENEIPVTMEAFEFYLTDPLQDPVQTRWKTLLAMPLK